MGYKRRYSLNQPLIIWVFFFFFKKNKTIIYVDLVWFSNILFYTELYIKECTSCEDHRFLHAITSYMLQESDFSFYRYKDPQTSHDPLNIDFIVWHCSIHNENLKKIKDKSWYLSSIRMRWNTFVKYKIAVAHIIRWENSLKNKIY